MISVDEILEKFDCPTCMCKLSDPHISKCGHTFCKVSFEAKLETCIFEWVNRNHDCPACRKPLQAEELFKNYSLELILCKLIGLT